MDSQDLDNQIEMLNQVFEHVPLQKSPSDENSSVPSKYILRPSVVEMEPSHKRRRNATLLFLSISFLMMIITPVWLLQRIGAVPRPPSATPMLQSISDYEAFVNSTNSFTYDDMYSVYSSSTQKQQSDCSERVTSVYSKQSAVKENTFNFTEKYCLRLAQRVFDFQSTQSFRKDPITTETCIDLSLENSTDQMLSWYVPQSNDPESSCIDSVMIEGKAYCLMQYFVQSNYTSCSLYYEFDSFPSLFTNSRPSTIPCQTFRKVFLLDAFQSTLSRTSLGAEQVYLAHVEYNEEYFLDLQMSFGQIRKFTGDLSRHIDNIESTAQKQYQKAKDNAEYITETFRRISKLKQFVQLIPIGFKFPSPPSLTIPSPIANGTFERMREQAQWMELESKGLPDYHPPPIASPNPVINITTPVVQYNTPTVNLMSSDLLRKMQQFIHQMLHWFSLLLALDLLFKFCFFLQDVAIVLREPRRDMSNRMTKTQRSLKQILAHSAAIVYAVVAIVFFVYLYSLGLSLRVVKEEIYNSCYNDVIVRNSLALKDFQTQIADHKTECNKVLATENFILDDFNTKFIVNSEMSVSQYESLYRAQNPNGVNAVDMQLPEESIGLETVELVPLQSEFEIDVYQLPSYDVCTQSAEAKTMSEEMDEYASDLFTYFYSVSAIAVVLLFGMRGISMGVQLVFWMELTKGYVCDGEFRSKQVDQKVTSKKRAGYAILTVVLIACITTISFLSS